MTLIERTDEMNSLIGELCSTTGGDGRVVLVSGPTAVGKTELVQAFARAAGERGAVLLSATATRGHRDRPLGLVAQLMRQAEPHSAQLRQLTENAVLTATLHMHGADDAHHVRPAVLHGLWTELATLARARPIVVVVDDLQYADVPSLTTLLFLARRASTGRVMLVFTLSADADPGRSALRGELLRLPHCRRLRLAPLSPAGLAALLGEVSGVREPPAVAAEAHALTGGNPLLARGLLVDNRRLGAEAGPGLVVGDGFTRAVVSCLHRTDGIVRRVGQGVALLGDDGDPALVADLLDVHPVLVDEAMTALRAAGLLGPGGFRHPRARAAVLETLDPDDLVNLHARAAVLRHRQGGPPLAVARHLVAAGHPSAGWTIGVLTDGAEQALAQGELDLALSCLRLADDQCSDARQRAAIRTTLAAIEWRIDPGTASRHLPDLVDALRQGLISGRHEAIVIEFLLWSGQIDTARAALTRLVERPGPPTGEAAVTIAALRPWLGHAFPELGQLLESRQPRSAALRPPRVLADPTLHGVDALAGAAPRGDDVARSEQLLAKCDPDELTLGTIVTSLAALMYADELEKAGSWCDRLLRALDGRRAPMWQALLTAMRAGIVGRQGDLRESQRQARDALKLLPAASWGVALAIPIATLILTAVGLGNLEDAAACLGVAMPPGLFQTSFGLTYLHARGRYHLAARDFPAALADFERCGEMLRRWNRDQPAMLPWRSDAALALLALDRPERARELLREQLDLLAPGQHRARGLTLRVLAGTVAPAERPALLHDALTHFEACSDRLNLALVFADISRTQELLGARPQAEAAARQAQLWARECGAEASVRRLLPATVRVDVTEEALPTVPDEWVTDLSDAERRVAGLAASGHTNREIADQLFVTISTVEQHLTRVYRKLNVRRRTDLPWELQTEGGRRG
ncbi:ATP-binding protein [Micromonospora sp. CA-244673]|uniref:ATP-binding protein n=1 Tax=Micromonospora sp. CA-244673 TaxID=3239958 RepID=UPI003D90846A